MASHGLQQVQKQTQSLVLAPQLRQSLKILQAPALELRNAILEELEHNPTLEELPMEGMSLEDSASGTDNAEDPDEVTISEDDYAILNRLNEDYREYFAQENAGNVYTSEDDERRRHFFDSLVSETSLQNHLIAQAEMVDLTAQEQTAIEYLIGSLDDRGFLTTSLPNIALMANLPLTSVQRASTVLRGLEPPGIGSSDLQECLLTQLRQSGRGNTLAARIVQEHFDRLLRRRIPEIARKAGATIDEVQEAIEVISGLDPAPGRRFSADNNRVIEPDVTVEKSGGQWVITLNEDYIPRLRIDNAYKRMIAAGTVRGKDREYLREKLRSGKFLISSIEQRQQTIQRITQEILKYQEPFFEHGVTHLKPLTMNQIAQEVGVHETTVSRAIANKFIETPHGIFEFKFFFTPGYTSGDGKTVSNKSIKDRIAQIIETEDSAKPLSDQEIVKIVAENDIKIARRTVAKYREELGIPPTSLRRQYR